MNLFFKGFGFVFTILFVWAAALQYNDPDPYFWYSGYGIAAFASMAFAIHKLTFAVAILLMVAYLIGGIISWPASYEGVAIGQGDIKNIEEGREALGLFFCAVVFFSYASRLRYVKGLKRG